MDGTERITAELSVSWGDLALTLRAEVPRGSSWSVFGGTPDPDMPLSEDATHAFPQALRLAEAMPPALRQAYQSLEIARLEAEASEAERAAAEMRD